MKIKILEFLHDTYSFLLLSYTERKRREFRVIRRLWINASFLPEEVALKVFVVAARAYIIITYVSTERFVTLTFIDKINFLLISSYFH